MARLRNSLKLTRASDPEAERACTTRSNSERNYRLPSTFASHKPSAQAGSDWPPSIRPDTHHEANIDLGKDRAIKEQMVSSTVSNVADINCDHQQFGYWATVGAHGKSASARRQLDAIGFSVVRRQLCCGKAAGNVDVIIVPPKQAVRSELKPLHGTVAYDMTWEIGA